MPRPRAAAKPRTFSADAPSTRFTYSVTPKTAFVTVEEAHPSYADLSFRIVNDSDDDIDCTSIILAVPIGTGREALSRFEHATPVSGQKTWTMLSLGSGNWLITPVAPTMGLKAHKEVEFQLRGILVNKSEGTAAIGVTETTDDSRTTSILVDKARSSLAITRFLAEPPEIDVGGETKLTWETAGADGCTLTHSAPAGPAVSFTLGDTQTVLPNYEMKVSPRVSSIYTLIAHGDGPSISATATVSVRRPAIVSHSPMSAQIDPGDDVTIGWNCEYADSVELTPDHPDPLDPTGTATVNPLVTTTYQLVPIRGDNTRGEPVHIPVNVRRVHIDDFHEEPSLDTPGAAARLVWSVKRAIECRLGPLVVDAVGSMDLKPIAPGLSHLVAIGYGGADRKSVAIGPRGWFPTPNNPSPVHSCTLIAGPDSLIRVCGRVPGTGTPNPNTDAYTDKDGWKTTRNSLTDRYLASGAWFDGHFWLVGGTDNPRQPYTAPTMLSRDGVTWRGYSGPQPWKGKYAVCAVRDGELWIFAGMDAWRSSNGTAWTHVPQSGPAEWAANLLHLTATSTGFASAGTNGVWESVNGSAWKRVDNPQAAKMTCVGSARGVLWAGDVIRNRAGVWRPSTTPIPSSALGASAFVATYRDRIFLLDPSKAYYLVI